MSGCRLSFTGQRGLEMLYSYLEISVYDSVQWSKIVLRRRNLPWCCSSSLSQLFDFRILPPSPIIALIYYSVKARFPRNNRKCLLMSYGVGFGHRCPTVSSNGDIQAGHRTGDPVIIIQEVASHVVPVRLLPTLRCFDSLHTDQETTIYEHHALGAFCMSSV